MDAESGTIGDTNIKPTEIAYDIGEHVVARGYLKNWRIIASYAFQCFPTVLSRFEWSFFLYSRIS